MRSSARLPVDAGTIHKPRDEIAASAPARLAEPVSRVQTRSRLSPARP